MLYAIDIVATFFFLVGFHVAFRQRLLRTWSGRFRHPHEGPAVATGASVEDPEGVASVFRIVGVMIMAFSFTGAAFANLITYYSSATN